MSRRTIGFLMFLLGLLAVLGEMRGIEFPTARWFFQAGRDVPLLRWETGAGTFPWFGWLSSAILICGGVWFFVRSFTAGPPNPVAVRRAKRFKEIKRGYYSLLILLFLAGFASLDQVVVGKEALAVRYGGKWFFPAFTPEQFKGSDFGIAGELADAPVDYRMLQKAFEKDGSLGKVHLPLIPYGSTDDTLPPRSKPLVDRQGVYYESGGRSPYYGLAARYHDIEKGDFHLRYTLRKGKLSGSVDGWDAEGERVYTAEYLNGGKGKEKYSGEGTVEDFLAIESSELRALKYHPSPPSTRAAAM